MKIKKRTLMIILGVIVTIIVVYSVAAIFIGENNAAANLPAMVGGC